MSTGLSAPFIRDVPKFIGAAAPGHDPGSEQTKWEHKFSWWAPILGGHARKAHHTRQDALWRQTSHPPPRSEIRQDKRITYHHSFSGRRAPRPHRHH